MKPLTDILKPHTNDEGGVPPENIQAAMADLMAEIDNVPMAIQAKVDGNANLARLELHLISALRYLSMMIVDVRQQTHEIAKSFMSLLNEEAVEEEFDPQKDLEMMIGVLAFDRITGVYRMFEANNGSKLIVP